MVLSLSVTALHAGEGEGTRTRWIELDDFVSEPRVLRVQLSPDGKQVAYVLREAAGVSVWSLDAATGQKRQRFRSKQVDGLHWATDSEGLFVEVADRIAYMPLGGGRPAWIFALDELREQRFLDVDPVLPAHILVAEKLAEGRHRLLRVDAAGSIEVVLNRPEPIRHFLIGEGGEIALLKGTDGLEQVIYRLDRGSLREVLRCDALDACSLLTVDRDLSHAFLRGRLREDLWQLSRLDVRTGASETVHRDPRRLADLDAVVVDPVDRTPLIATYHSDRRRHYGLTASVREQLAVLEGALPERDLDFEARKSGPYWLVQEAGDRLQYPRYHLYEVREKALRSILAEEREETTLPEDALVQGEFMSYEAGDGLPVHGFLWLPKGVLPSSAPLVVSVHGGPWNHVRSGFNTFTQFLAHRGYIVFEPNFRASTGYGLNHIVSAKGDFGDGRVQQDILDGIDHLLGRGIGDSERVAIVGHSFGGFSALGGLAFTPKRFRAAIASAPAIDLGRALDDVDEDFTMPNGLPQKRVLSGLVDLDGQGAERLRQRSPEANLARTERPLLLLAGARDDRVDVVDVKHYAASLAALGRDVSLLVDPEAGHSFTLPGLRKAYLYLAERFLAYHLGGETQPVSDPDLEAYLQRNLLLVGPSLEAALRPTRETSPRSP